MTPQENVFLRDLRRVLKEHEVKLLADYASFGDAGGMDIAWFQGNEILIDIDRNLAEELAYGSSDAPEVHGAEV